MVSRPPRFRRLHTLEPETAQVKLIDENIDDTDRIIGANVIIEMLGEQRTLFAILAFDKALHFTPVAMRYWLNVYRADFVYTVLRFYTAWAKSRHSESNNIENSWILRTFLILIFKQVH